MEEDDRNGDAPNTRDLLHAHQSAAGRAGGRSKSPAKRDAARANLAKGRAKRWPGREAAALVRIQAMEALNSHGLEGEQDGNYQETEEREVLRGSGGPEQEHRPPRPSPGSDQPDSGDGQPEDGGLHLQRYPGDSEP